MVRRVFLVFLVFGMVGCGIDVTDPESVSGFYTLRTLNGEGLPAVFIEIGATFLVEVTAGSGTLNEDLTCSFSLSFKRTEDGTVTTSTELNVCTYTLDGGSTS